MRVGLMADTHDRVPAVAELLRRLQAAGAGIVLHAGDYCAPFVFDAFVAAHLPVAGVFGRNDGDHEGLRASAARVIGAELFESPHSLTLEERSILLVHDLGEVTGRSLDAHDVIVHGCSHHADVRKRGDTLIVNPGEACGWLYGVPTAAILDLETRTVEMLTLDGPEWRG